GKLLRSGLAVINANHTFAVVIPLRYRGFRNLSSRIGCAFNRRIFADCLLGNTRRHIYPELQPQAVDLVSDGFYTVSIAVGREWRWICHPAAIFIDVGTLRARALVPEIVEIYVFITHLLQAGFMQRTCLSFKLICRGTLAKKAPATPAENGRALEAVILCLGVLRSAYAGQQPDH